MVVALRDAALAGALLGVGLTLAEVSIGVLSGGSVPPSFVLFVASYDVPALAALAGVICVAGRAAFSQPHAPSTLQVLSATLHVTVACYLVVLLKIPHLGYPPPVLASLVATLVASTASGIWFHRARPPARGNLVWFAVWLPFIAVGLSHILLSARPRTTLTELVLSPLVFLSIIAVWWAVSRFGNLLALCAIFLLLLCVGLTANRALSRELAHQLKREPHPSGAGRESKTNFNLVLIVTDTLRAKSLSPYGYARATTPNIDRLAQGGTVYLNCLSYSPRTVPAHASLFTGLYPPRHGVYRPGRFANGLVWFQPLSEELDTLAEIAERQGYATAALVANYPQVSLDRQFDQGFQYFDARPPSAYPRLNYEPFVLKIAYRLPRRLVADRYARWYPTPYRSAKEMTDLAVDWLGRRPPGVPFFLFINYLDAHAPYAARGGFRARWVRPELEGRFPPHGIEWARKKEALERRRPLTGDETEYLQGLYDASVEYLDDNIGRLVGEIEGDTQGESMIVLVGDHGEALGEHGDIGHGTSLYQEQIHVPLIIRYPPSLRRAAERDPQMAQLVDVMPTVLKVLGIEAPSGIDGMALAGQRERQFAECFPDELHVLRLDTDYYDREQRVLVRDGLKLLRTTNQPSHLFDLGADPTESNDLGGDRPDALAAMEEELQEWRERASSRVQRPGEEALRPELVDALRALGYVE